jgi:hypothetical protein
MPAVTGEDYTLIIVLSTVLPALILITLYLYWHFCYRKEAHVVPVDEEETHEWGSDHGSEGEDNIDVGSTTEWTSVKSTGDLDDVGEAVSFKSSKKPIDDFDDVGELASFKVQPTGGDFDDLGDTPVQPRTYDDDDGDDDDGGDNDGNDSVEGDKKVSEVVGGDQSVGDFGDIGDSPAKPWADDDDDDSQRDFGDIGDTPAKPRRYDDDDDDDGDSEGNDEESEASDEVVPIRQIKGLVP